MTTLMDIRNQYLQMLDIVSSAEDAAEGDVDEIDDKIYMLLDNVEAELLDKLESCASVRDALLAGAEQIKQRLKVWKTQKKRLEANSKRLREWMAFNMREAGINDAETDLYKMKFGKKAAYALELDYNAFDEWVEAGNGDGLYKRQGPQPDKRAIVAELKGGNEVPGYKLITDEKTLGIR